MFGYRARGAARCSRCRLFTAPYFLVFLFLRSLNAGKRAASELCVVNSLFEMMFIYGYLPRGREAFSTRMLQKCYILRSSGDFTFM